MCPVNLQVLVEEISEYVSHDVERGTVADYIPTLRSASTKQFGISIVDKEGRIFSTGDADTIFSIQSISKVFSLTLALGSVGDALWKRVGREPSGSAFNSIVQLEQ